MNFKFLEPQTLCVGLGCLFVSNNLLFVAENKFISVGGENRLTPMERARGDVKPLGLLFKCPMFNLLRGLCPIKSSQRLQLFRL